MNNTVFQIYVKLMVAIFYIWTQTKENNIREVCQILLRECDLFESDPNNRSLFPRLQSKTTEDRGTETDVMTLIVLDSNPDLEVLSDFYRDMIEEKEG